MESQYRIIDKKWYVRMKKKIIQLDVEEKKQNNLVIKLKLRGREIAKKDVHDKSKLTDFGEGCS